MEIIMSTISSAPAPQGLLGQSLLVGPVAALKRWWIAYLTWRMEQAAIAHLWSLSDRTLKDMGLTRSEIPRVVRGGLAEHTRSRGH
jgi:uncharacterized protein YjiS (DUF1127 family)